MSLRDRFTNNPFLQIVTSNVFDIPQRVKEYDPSMFIVWNIKKQKFEAHSTENKGLTYCFTIPYRELDCRTLDMIRQGDIRNRGDVIFKEMHESNRKLEESQEKDFKRNRRDAIKETRWHFKKTAEELGI